MNYWVQSSTWMGGFDMAVLEEAALAMAQSTIQNAMNDSGLNRSELARRMECDRSFVSRMLSGGHNLTIKTMAKSLAACGFEIRFQPVPIVWNWANIHKPSSVQPAESGQYPADTRGVGRVVPAFA